MLLHECAAGLEAQPLEAEPLEAEPLLGQCQAGGQARAHWPHLHCAGACTPEPLEAEPQAVCADWGSCADWTEAELQPGWAEPGSGGIRH